MEQERGETLYSTMEQKQKTSSSQRSKQEKQSKIK